MGFENFPREPDFARMGLLVLVMDSFSLVVLKKLCPRMS
jgi:hypothetical protein